jgi:hypothetical protein
MEVIRNCAGATRRTTKELRPAGVIVRGSFSRRIYNGIEHGMVQHNCMAAGLRLVIETSPPTQNSSTLAEERPCVS